MFQFAGPDLEQEKKQELLHQRYKVNREQYDNDLTKILTTDEGKRFIYALVEYCGFLRSSFTPSAEIYFLEGRRDIALKLLSDVERLSPETALKIIQLRLERNKDGTAAK